VFLPLSMYTWHFFDFSICSLEGRDEMDEGIFLIVGTLG